jgi:hypothetical protein
MSSDSPENASISFGWIQSFIIYYLADRSMSVDASSIRKSDLDSHFSKNI